MYQCVELFKKSWAFRFWAVRGAILLLIFLISLVVIFEMNWLSVVLTVIIPVVALVVFISLVASLLAFIGTYKK
jgi:hypothetical protein